MGQVLIISGSHTGFSTEYDRMHRTVQPWQSAAAHSLVNDQQSLAVAHRTFRAYRLKAAFGVIPMMSLPIKIVVSALVLAFVSAASAEAAKSRKSKRGIAAPTVVTASPQYRGTN